MPRLPVLPEPHALVADRFARIDAEHAWDLALDRAAILRCVDASSVTTAWHERTALLSALVHPWLVPCVDFGDAGDAGFEAYLEAPAARRGNVPTPPDRRAAVVRLLHASGVTAGTLEGGRTGQSVMPGTDTGYPLTPARRAIEARRWARGVGHEAPAIAGGRLVARAAWKVCVDWLDAPGPCALRWVRIAGGRGTGRTTTLRWVAREARLRGWRVLAGSVIVSASLVDPARLMALVADRHLLVLHDAPGTSFAAVARALLTLAMGTPFPVVVLSTDDVGPRDAVTLELPAWSEAELRRTIVIAGRGRDANVGRLVRRAAAARERPWPWLPSDMPADARGLDLRARVAREEPAVDDWTDVAAFPADGGVGPSLRIVRAPAVAAWLQRAARARALVEAGRHAAGEHELRAAVAGLARAGADTDAAAWGTTLASVLVRRGRGEEAIAVAASAASRTTAPAVQAAAALVRAEALVEGARFTEAETALRAVLVADDGNAVPAWQPRVSLAAVLVWRGRLAEAAWMLDASPAAVPDDVRADWVRGRAEVAAVMGDAYAAGRHAHAAIVSAAGRGDPEVRARLTRAEVLGAAGQIEAAMADAFQAGRLASRRHAPLWVLRALIVSARLQHAAGDEASWRRSVRCLRRWLTAPVPALVRLEAWRVLAVLGGDEAAGARARAVMRTAGVTDAWWARAPLRGARRPEAGPMLDDLLRVLELCHDAEDERDTLTRVGTLVRDRLGAASVAFLVLDGRVLSPVAQVGTRWRAHESPLSQRAVESGLPMPPQPTDAGCEAAVPVRYGAAPVGVLACRWLPGEERGCDPLMLLSATAAASASCLRVALDRRVPVREAGDPMPELVGVSAAIAEVRRAVARAAAAPFPVLIEGESGCGKELVARAIHRLGPRRARRFCEVNGAAIADDLLESELFGHARGAFTGAIGDRRGLFEEADGGSLFLDEVGELSPRAQAKLLRAIQEGEVRRVGETASRKVDVRMIAATNRSLPSEVEAGRFRHDLLYRLDVIRISVPPLRDRAEDIPVLAQHFWRRATERTGSRATLGAEAVAALAQHAWPGNVRELQNVLAALAVAAPPRGRVGVAALPAAIVRGTATDRCETLETARRRFEERFVRAVLARHNGHRAHAAAQLGLSRQGLAKLLARLGMEESPKR